MEMKERIELVNWLEKSLDRNISLQISHPHLAWIPTEQDRETFQKIKKIILGDENAR